MSKPIHEDGAKVDALFASIGEGVIVTDEYGHITRANKVALDIIGYDEVEVLGRWFVDVVVAVDSEGNPSDNLDRPITRAFIEGRTITDELNYRRKDGSTVPVAVVTSPIIMEGEPIGAVQIFRDISLEQKVDKLKSEFISIAAHQLRTPLSSINIYTHMLEGGFGGELSATQSSFIANILSACERMTNLINTLLNVTRLEASGIVVDRKRVEMEPLVRELVDSFRTEATEHGVRIRLVVESDIPAISTDATLVREIVSNLISNAIKYTDDNGQVTVKLRIEGNSVVVKVKDSGYGIPVAAQPHVFEKFFRADNIITHNVSGTGLGLYLVKTIANKLAGDVWFVSREGKGSTFFFALPLRGTARKSGRFRIEKS